MRAGRVMSIAYAAGSSTWCGPTADRFGADLNGASRALLDAADGLDAQARALEQQADHLDLLAAIAAAHSIQ